MNLIIYVENVVWDNQCPNKSRGLGAEERKHEIFLKYFKRGNLSCNEFSDFPFLTLVIQKSKAKASKKDTQTKKTVKSNFFGFQDISN